ncbi:Gfo/Idh/MocA family oxidoreductase [Nakamurella flavida]|uniref:Gfo/Idh/MocA family oxidoreductase n=1 Tax=Nakamurella flavida TaxID=363630 RepID=A0A939C1E6_9ACTN|nr:Gfo/Idh/MocA family oxidoreductase [Nakamurella flavida]MBM9477613.1 Gfo/Idh/MocA family oxidoreductase [Nakamurella flavida]MDP9779161.1 putative dehydrogenase [Nakamurella flavida]
MTAPVRLAVIGCGRIAQIAHFPALEKADGIELVAVCDPAEDIARAVATRYAVPAAYSDPRQVFDDPTIEAVLVAAPDRFHHTLAADALTAGKHVLVEKPLCSTVEQARELVDLVDRTGLVLQVGAMKRHDAGMQFARRFVTEELGQVRTFTAWYRIGDLRAGIEATLFPRVYADAGVRQVEAGFKADRSRYLLATHGAHIFDTVRYLAGEVTSVVARHRDDGTDQAWQIILITDTGAIGTVSLTVDVPGQPSEGIEVFGSDGTVRVDTHFPFYRRASTVHAYSAGRTVVPELVDGDAYERQAEAFAATVRSGGRPVPDVRDGLAAVDLIDAVAQAAETGREIRC